MTARYFIFLSLLVALAGCAEDSGAADPSSSDTGDAAGTTDASDTNARKTGPDWHGEVAAIIGEHCASCHTENGIGPFRLDRASDWQALAQPAWNAIKHGTMPPFMADPSCGKFAKVRTLKAADKNAIEKWLSAGMPLGDPATASKLPEVKKLQKTHSAVMPDEYTPPSTLSDDYRCFLLDLEFAEDMYLEGSQVVPGAAGLVHHVLVYALHGDYLKSAQAADAKEKGPGYICFGGPLPSSDGSAVLAQFAGGFPTQLAAWVPGLEPTVYPQDAAIRIRKGSRIVMQIHYNIIGGKTAVDRTRLDMILVTKAPKRLVMTRPLLIHDLSIQPNMTTAHERTFRYYGKGTLSIGSLTPHMHLLGTSFKATIVRADGSEECGISIPKWDFQWQQGYARPLGEPILLADGDGMRVRCVYDNKAANQPEVDGKKIVPKHVKWGDGSFDEMCMLYMDMTEAFSPSPPEGAKPCHGFSACEDKCNKDGRLDCIMSCGEVRPECQTCAIGKIVSCGVAKCPFALAGAQSCLTNCLVSRTILGSNAGACLAAECADKYAAARKCLDKVLLTAACVDKLALCGL